LIYIVHLPLVNKNVCLSGEKNNQRFSGDSAD